VFEIGDREGLEDGEGLGFLGGTRLPNETKIRVIYVERGQKYKGGYEKEFPCRIRQKKVFDFCKRVERWVRMKASGEMRWRE
jgi:hypothetical protein